MDIEGPFRIGIVDNPARIGRELCFGDTPVFQALDRDERTAQLRVYMDELRAQASSASAGARERRDMPVVLQPAETLLPRVAADANPPGEAMVVDMAPHLSSPPVLATRH